MDTNVSERFKMAETCKLFKEFIAKQKVVLAARMTVQIPDPQQQHSFLRLNV